MATNFVSLTLRKFAQGDFKTKKEGVSGSSLLRSHPERSDGSSQLSSYEQYFVKALLPTTVGIGVTEIHL